MGLTAADGSFVAGLSNTVNLVNVTTVLFVTEVLFLTGIENSCSPKINLNFFDENAITEDFLAWRMYTQDKVIVLQHDESGELLKIPWVTRFDEPYRKKIYARFMQLVRSLEKAPCSVIFGTLTVDPKKLSKIEALRKVKGAWHNLHMLLNKRKRAGSGITSCRGMDYICCVEPQKSGMVHLHFLVFWAVPSDFVDDYTVVQRWNSKKEEYVSVGVSPSLDAAWQKYGFGRINQFEGVRFDAGRMKQVASYLLKYISKQHANVGFAAALWATRVRSYSASKLITTMMLQSLTEFKDKCWSFLGVVSLSLLEFCSDRELVDIIYTQHELRLSSKQLVMGKYGT